MKKTILAFMKGLICLLSIFTLSQLSTQASWASLSDTILSDEIELELNMPLVLGVLIVTMPPIPTGSCQMFGIKRIKGDYMPFLVTKMGRSEQATVSPQYSHYTESNDIHNYEIIAFSGEKITLAHNPLASIKDTFTGSKKWQYYSDSVRGNIVTKGRFGDYTITDTEGLQGSLQTNPEKNDPYGWIYEDNLGRRAKISNFDMELEPATFGHVARIKAVWAVKLCQDIEVPSATQ